MLAQTVAAQAQALGTPQLAGMLQQAVDSAWVASNLAPMQDRQAITARLKIASTLNPQGLKAAIEAKKLELPATIYGQICSALNSGKHIILIGPPGTGKTTLANALCQHAQEEGLSSGMQSTTATADWSTFDTVGGYVPTANQTLQFRLGSFLSAIAAANWLVIDEINRAEIDKAFGELFTVLSGQGVDLPYSVGKQAVRIRPSQKGGADGWLPTPLADYDYVVYPTWRIIGTMNVYDKSTLFNMSLAFMRRFAFIDVDLPAEPAYKRLRDGWIDQHNPLGAEPAWEDLKVLFDKLLDRASRLMHKRALGPAITRDMIEYIGDRFPNRVGGETMESIFGEALLLYATPQLDGLDHESIELIHDQLRTLLGVVAETGGILARIAAFYPHILEWKKAN